MESEMVTLKNVEAVFYDTGGHVLFGHEDKNRKIITEFLARWSENHDYTTATY